MADTHSWQKCLFCEVPIRNQCAASIDEIRRIMFCGSTCQDAHQVRMALEKPDPDDVFAAELAKGEMTVAEENEFAQEWIGNRMRQGLPWK